MSIATATSSATVSLTWTASTDNVGVTGYRILRGGVQIATSTSPSFADSGLSPSTKYSYTVIAVDAAANASASECGGDGDDVGRTRHRRAIDSRQSHRRQRVDRARSGLSWTASTDNLAVAGYNVYRGGTLIGTTLTPAYQDSGLTAQTAYSYTVAAFDAAGNMSPPSSSRERVTTSGTTTRTLKVNGNSLDRQFSGIVSS